MNSRLDTLQAVVLRAKLRRLAGWNDAAAPGRPAVRRRCSAAGDGVVLPDRPARATSTCGTSTWCGWPHRDAVLAHLAEAGIGAGIHYPQPVHLLGAYADLGYGPATSRWPRRPPASSCRCRSSRASRAAQQERVATELVAALEGRR